MAFSLAELFVTIKADESALSRSLSGLRSSLGSMAGGMGGILGGMFGAPLRAANALADTVGRIGKGVALGGVAAAVGGVAVAMYQGVTGAVKLQDTMSATEAVLGSSASTVFRWADDMAAKFGTVKNESIDAALNFAQSFKAIGKSPQEAADLGTQIAKLGMDLASFKGTSNAEAFTALQAAFRGEFDPLERFGIMLSAAAVQEQALSSGLVKRSKDMDENAKKMGALALITGKSRDMTGDLERTADQAGNQWKKLTGTLTNAATDVGTMLMPALTSVLQLGGDMAVGLAGYFESNKATIAGWGQTIVGWVDEARMVFRNLGDIWEMVTVQGATGFLNFINVLAVIPANVAIIGKYIADNWYQLIYDGVSASIVVFQNFAENLRRIMDAVWEYMRNPAGGFRVDFKPLLEGFSATSAALPDLIKPQVVDASEQLARIQDRIAAREGDRLTAKAAADAAARAGQPAKEAAQQAMAAKAEKDFKSQSFAAEDYFSHLKQQAGAGADDTPKRQLAEQKRTADAAEKTASILGGGALTARLA